METYLEEAGHFVVAADDDAVRLSLDLPPLIIVVRDVPTTQPRLALPVLQQNKPNLHQKARPKLEILSITVKDTVLP